MSNLRKRKRIINDNDDKEYLPKRIKYINSIDDLIEYMMENNFENDKLNNIYLTLLKINNLIGMTELKKKLIDQILYFVSGSDKYDLDGSLMHTVIYGLPGTGKTQIATLIGEIYSNLGFIKSTKITYGSRNSFIAEYVGQTGEKTLRFLKLATPGILIIDEVYSLSSGLQGHDSYSKEAIDVINQYLSEHKKDLLCIIIGYPQDVQTCFFDLNKGLDRRFPFRYTIENYSFDELVQIFKAQVKENKWNITQKACDLLKIIITNNKELFKNYGGDTENLLFCCKLIKAKRLFFDSSLKKFLIDDEDIALGFEEFKKSKIDKNINVPPPSMYI